MKRKIFGKQLIIIILILTLLTTSAFCTESVMATTVKKEYAINSVTNQKTLTRENLVKFAKKYYGKNLKYFLDRNTPCFWDSYWCAMYMSYVTKTVIPKSQVAKKSDALCSKWYNSLPKTIKKVVYKKPLKKRYVPQKGDIIFFEYDRYTKGVDHVGMVVSVNKKKHTVTTIEGNINNKNRNADYHHTYVLYRTYKMTDTHLYAYVKTV